jgi:malic enzyme
LEDAFVQILNLNEKAICENSRPLTITRKEDLEKIEVIPTKDAKTQRDLSLAYSPVWLSHARKIAAHKEDVL